MIRLSLNGIFALSLCVITTGTRATSAQFLDGNELHRYCSLAPAVALGYTMGIADELRVNLNVITPTGESVIPKKFVCIPNGVEGEQVKHVVCRHLEGKPGDRHLPAAILAYSAMLETWRCASP